MPVDMLGKAYAVGQTIVRSNAKRYRVHPGLCLRKVIKVTANQVWLDGVLPRPLLYPDRCIIVRDPE